jgi:transposase
MFIRIFTDFRYSKHGAYVIISTMKTAEKLQKSLEESHALIDAQREEIDYLKQRYNLLLEQIKLEKLRRYAPKSEANVLQLELNLFDEAESEAKEAEPVVEEKETITYDRNKPKRKPLPKELPREEITHDITDSEKICICGCEKKHIGEEISEQLEVIPASIKVIAHIRPKYACNKCDSKVDIAKMPEFFLPKTMASESLVAYTIISKFQDHLPLYRQEKIWQRMGINIPRNTMGYWIIKSFENCLPLYDVFVKELFSSTYLQVDETTVQVMNEEGRKNTSKSYIWVYKSMLPDKKLILYDYKPTREGKWPEHMMRDFNGYLQTDGYYGYSFANDKKNIIKLGCMAHARRPFAELVKIAKKTGKSHIAISYIKKLYIIEKYAREHKLTHQERYELRLKKSQPLLDDFFAWVDESLKTAVPKSKLGNGLKYIQNRKNELSHYLLDGSLEIDNNAVENKIRPFAIGRKNWMFSGSTNGAQASSFFFSLINSAVDNGLNSFEYLHYLFKNIKKCQNEDDYYKLLPHVCKIKK